MVEKNNTQKTGAQVKPQKKQSKWILYCFIALCAVMLVEAGLFFHKYGLYMRLTAYIGIPLVLAIGIIFFICKKFSMFRLIFSTLVVLEVFILMYIILDLFGVFDTLTDMEQVRRLILSTGNWGKFIFCLIQLLQVVVLPVPAIIFYLVGIALYGPHVTFLLSSFTVIIGSMMAFGIGRLAGERFVGWIVGKEDAKKYRRYLGDKGKFALIIMLLFPFFPDDVLCMAAGLTTMSWLFFFITILITRTLNVGITCYFGSGAIIPFHGWGIAVWIAIIVVLAILFFVVNKNKERLINAFSFNKKRPLIKIKDGSVYSINSAKNVLPEKIQVKAEKEE